MNPHPLATFLSYSHAGQKLRKKLREHFVQLERDGLIRLWDDRELQIGQDIDASIAEMLELTEVFILLVSQDFIASPYCSGIEMKRALERHEEGTALVLPIIATPCDWKHSPLAKLLVAPTSGKPISNWSPRDAGWTDATSLTRRAIVSFRERLFNRPILAPATPLPPAPRAAEPRPVPPPPADLAAVKAQPEMAAAPAPPQQRIEKTELVPLYFTLPGFQVPKAVVVEDQEETARVAFEPSLPQPHGSAEETESLDAPPPPDPPAVEPTIRLPEPPPPSPPVEPRAGPAETAPPPEDVPHWSWRTRRQWMIVTMAVFSAVVLMVAATAFMCSSLPDSQRGRAATAGRQP